MKNRADQKGAPGILVKTSAITMKAKPVPWAESSSSFTREQFLKKFSGCSLEYPASASRYSSSGTSSTFLPLNSEYFSSRILTSLKQNSSNDPQCAYCLLLHALLELVNCFEAEDGEYHSRGVDSGEGITYRDDDDVLEKRKIIKTFQQFSFS